MKKTMAKDKEVSKLDQLKNLKEQAQQLETQLKDDLMAEVKAKLDELRELGFDYILTEGKKPVAVKAEGKITRQRDPNKPCKVCGQTGHDARKHRSDNIAKKKAGA